MNNPSKSPGKAALSVWGQENRLLMEAVSFSFSGYPVKNSFKVSNNSRGWFLAHVRWICYINRSLPVSVQCTAPGSAFMLVVTLYHVFLVEEPGWKSSPYRRRWCPPQVPRTKAGHMDQHSVSEQGGELSHRRSANNMAIWPLQAGRLVILRN